MSINFSGAQDQADADFKREIRRIASQQQLHSKTHQLMSQAYRRQGEALCGLMPSPHMTIHTMRGVSSVEISTPTEEVKPTSIAKPHGFRNAVMTKVAFWRRVLAILFPLHF